MTWGSLNVYYFSYYKHFDDDLDYKWNSLFLIIVTPPIAIVSIFSLRLA